MNRLGGSEIRLHVHPQFRSAELENEMLSYAEDNFYAETENGRRYIYMPIFVDDTHGQEITKGRAIKKAPVGDITTIAIWIPPSPTRRS